MGTGLMETLSKIAFSHFKKNKKMNKVNEK